MGSSSPTRKRTWAPCIGSAESYPLDHQGSPWAHFFKGSRGLLLEDVLRGSNSFLCVPPAASLLEALLVRSLERYLRLHIWYLHCRL